MMDYYLDDSSFPYSTSISNVKQQEDHIQVKSYGNLLVNDDNLSSKTNCLNEQCQSILLINNS
jgi:hypothetical protein